MVATFTLETNEDSYNLNAQVACIGNDILVAIWGGDRPHIGAVSAAIPRASLKDPAITSATASTICYPSHKDDEITKKISEQLTSALKTQVVVCAGVHFNNIDDNGIGKVLKNSQILTELIINKIASISQSPAYDRAGCSFPW